MSEIIYKLDGDIRVIPYIKKGKILDIVGENGIGKTTSVKLLEIIGGNHIFQNIRKFNSLSGAIDSCKINLKFSDNEHIIVELNPRTWEFDPVSRKIKNHSLGTFYLNNSEISVEKFQQLCTVNVFRGDETPSKQIEYISDYLRDFFNYKREFFRKLQKAVSDYQVFIEADFEENNIITYLNKQEELDSIVKEIEDNKNIIQNYQDELFKLNKANELLEDLMFLIENDREKLIQQKEIKEAELKSCENKIENLINEKNKLRRNFENYKKEQKELDENFKQLLIEYEKIREKRERILKKISDILETPVEQFARASVTDLQNRINIQQKNLERAKQNLQNLLNEQETKIKFTNLVDQVYQASKQAISYGIIDTWPVIEIDRPEYHIELTFSEIYEILKGRINSLVTSNDIKEIKRKASEIQVEIDKIEQIKSEIKKLLDIKKELSSISSQLDEKGKNKLDKFIIEGTEESFLKKLNKINNDIETIKEKRRKIELNLNDLKNRLIKLEKLGKKIDYELELKNLDIGVDLTKNLSAELNKIDVRKGNISFEINTLKNYIKDKESKLNHLKSEIESLKNAIKINAEKHNFDKTIDWVNYVNIYLKRIRNLINLLDTYKQQCTYLINEIEMLRKGKQENRQIANILTKFYREFFLMTYNQPEFFEFVFPNYKKIIDFNIKTKELIALTKNGTEERRSLDDFSSGEKAYAFIRAMMAINVSKSKYRIIVLDELYALMDYRLTKSLLDLENKLIKEKLATKIINIKPIKSEDIKNLDENFANEYENHKFYQKIILN